MTLLDLQNFAHGWAKARSTGRERPRAPTQADAERFRAAKAAAAAAQPHRMSRVPPTKVNGDG